MATEIIKFSDRAVILEKPEAKFRIIYSNHYKSTLVHDLRDVDALAVEYVYFSEIPLLKLCDIYLGEQKKLKPQGTEFKKYLEESKTPVYFIDLVDADYKSFSIVKVHEQITIVELVCGIASGAFGLKKLKELKIKSDRRQFLKFLGFSGLAAYFALPIALRIGLDMYDLQIDDSAEESLRRGFDRQLESFNEKNHPETESWLLTFRNKIWAHKLDLIAEKITKEIGGKPEIAVIVGKRHVGLEEALQENPVNRVREIRKIYGFFDKIFGLRRIKISAAPHFEYFPEIGWFLCEVIKDPDLERIENE